MLRKLQEKFLPRFFEESLFFISVILLTLLCIDPDLRSIFSGDTDEMVMMGMAWFLFIGISVYSVFSKRPLPNVMRYFTVVFATMVVVLLSLVAAIEIFDRAKDQYTDGSVLSYVLLAFPLYNFARAIFVMMCLRFSDEYDFGKNLSEKQTHAMIALIGGEIAIVFVLVGYYFLHLSFSMTFSFTYFLLEPALAFYYEHIVS